MSTPAANSSPSILAVPSPASPEAQTRRSDAGGARVARRKPRVPLRVPCKVYLPGDSASPLCGQTVNVSADGLALRLSQPLPEGTWVEAVVPRPAGENLTVSGTVIHSRRVLADLFEIGIGTSRPRGG